MVSPLAGLFKFLPIKMHNLLYLFTIEENNWSLRAVYCINSMIACNKGLITTCWIWWGIISSIVESHWRQAGAHLCPLIEWNKCIISVVFMNSQLDAMKANVTRMLTLYFRCCTIQITWKTVWFFPKLLLKIILLWCKQAKQKKIMMWELNKYLW